MQVSIIIQTVYSDDDEQSFIHSVWQNQPVAEEYCKELNYYNNVDNLTIKPKEYLKIWSNISDEFFKIYEDWSGDENEVFKGQLAQAIVEKKYNLLFTEWINAYELYTMAEQGESIKFHVKTYDVI